MGDETRRRSVWFESNLKPIARISAVTALCSYATFWKLVVADAYAHTCDQDAHLWLQTMRIFKIWPQMPCKQETYKPANLMTET